MTYLHFFEKHMNYFHHFAILVWRTRIFEVTKIKIQITALCQGSYREVI